MRQSIQGFEPGTLWAKVKARTAHAIQFGAIQSIPTRSGVLEQGGVNFLVRIVSALARKARAKADQKRSSVTGRPDRNPFLPYDPDLFVADISSTHVCLLNKFNVLDHHILLVTRSFQEQESLLTLSDFQALSACLAEFDGLAFYNAGEAAGASQRHKHLQMVPLPLTPETPELPMEPLFRTARFQGGRGVVSALPFVHVITRVDPRWIDPSGNGSRELFQQYLNMLQAVGLSGHGTGDAQMQSGPYNLLVTRQWMFLVPRSTECFFGISVNALGFVGGMLVKDEEQLHLLKQHGPMTALQHVAVSSKPFETKI